MPNKPKVGGFLSLSSTRRKKLTGREQRAFLVGQKAERKSDVLRWPGRKKEKRVEGCLELAREGGGFLVGQENKSERGLWVCWGGRNKRVKVCCFIVGLWSKKREDGGFLCARRKRSEEPLRAMPSHVGDQGRSVAGRDGD